MTTKKRKLKVWNGHLLFINSDEGALSKDKHVNICAYSQEDALALLSEYGHSMTLGYFRNYWFNCWGNSMDGIEMERGIWVEFREGIPVRLDPKDKP